MIHSQTDPLATPTNRMVHYVVIDFESTCDEPHNPEPQEIIEFPAVLVTPDGKIADQFHAYVRPIAHPQLTPFCLNLTGIDQQRVDAANTFPDVLQAFESWLQHVPSPRKFVTCGDWDFGSMLPRQCAQWSLNVPDWAKSWCNLKHCFKARHINLLGMLDSVGLQPIGRLHSGIDDTYNIARIVQRLLELGELGGER